MARGFCSLMISILFIAISSSSAREYLSQTDIDTSIQKAYYYFNAAGPEAGAPMTQDQAIAFAKNVIKHMKELAVGDPNEKYILWKLGELETQTALEEDEVRRKREIASVKDANDLILSFNSETGKKRPDFAVLYAIQSSVLDLMPSKGNELADLVEKRNKGVTMEVRSYVNYYIDREKFDSAAVEVDYLRKNRKYLGIGGDEFNKYDNIISVRRNSANFRKTISTLMEQIASAVLFCDIAGAHAGLDQFDQFMKIGGLTTADAVNFRQQAGVYRARINKKEDSLVNVAIALIGSKGVDATIAYENAVLKPHNVSREKLAYVDCRMTGSATTAPTKADVLVANDLATFKDDTNPSSQSFWGATMSDLNSKAEHKIEHDNNQRGTTKPPPRPIGGVAKK